MIVTLLASAANTSISTWGYGSRPNEDNNEKKNVVIAEFTLVNGKPYELYPDKKLKSGTLGIETLNHGIVFAASSDISLSPEGRIVYGKLGRMTSINGIDLPEGTLIKTAPDGKLEWVEVPSDTAINGVLYSYQQRIEFSSDGKVNKGLTVKEALKSEQQQSSRTIAANAAKSLPAALKEIDGAVYLAEGLEYSNGAFRSGTLARAGTVGGAKLPAGSEVRIDDYGYFNIKIGEKGTRIHPREELRRRNRSGLLE